ncbi:hypothetical protein [Aurantiacibacter gilvus]|uniref:Cyanovirin-N domain-containing protein n=1 Tax=Aurantiacibacter gilvus TaxID=3139141 RepID=A0ABU9IHM0_9SPHN
MLHLVLLLAAQFAADALPVGTYNGTCLYPEALRERAAPGELVTCNQVEIAADHIAFGLRSWQSRTRFNGTFEGNRMTVDSVTLASGRSYDARGVCELSYANEALSTVACTVTSNRGAMAANFIVSRL